MKKILESSKKNYFSETYVAQDEDELSVIKGEKVEVTQKFIDGYWRIKRGKNSGMVPSDNLRSLSTSDTPIPKPRRRAKRGQSKAKRK